MTHESAAYGTQESLQLNAQPDIDLPDDPKVEQAIFGREVQDFIEHDRIGKYLIAKAMAEIESAATELLTVDPTDVGKLRFIQNRAAVANLVRVWLGQAVQDGMNAEVVLQAQRDGLGNG
jgi:hypothetical protein